MYNTGHSMVVKSFAQIVRKESHIEKQMDTITNSAPLYGYFWAAWMGSKLGRQVAAVSLVTPPMGDGHNLEGIVCHCVCSTYLGILLVKLQDSLPLQ